MPEKKANVYLSHRKPEAHFKLVIYTTISHKHKVIGLISNLINFRFFKSWVNRLFSELVTDWKIQLSERDKQRFTVM